MQSWQRPDLAAESCMLIAGGATRDDRFMISAPKSAFRSFYIPNSSHLL